MQHELPGSFFLPSAVTTSARSRLSAAKPQARDSHPIPAQM